MNLKSKFLYAIIFTFVLFISEIVNFISNPTSLSSVALNNFFIRRSIYSAQNKDGNGSVKFLEIASKMNIIGEYSHYRSRLPNNYLENIELKNVDVEIEFEKYISNLSKLDLKTGEDQGLGKIYYDLALISYSMGEKDLTPKLLKMAIYNNPEFASFHAELINYFFIENDNVNLDKSMKYCEMFEGAKTLCGQYKNDSLKSNIPQKVGYMQDEVVRHYKNN